MLTSLTSTQASNPLIGMEMFHNSVCHHHNGCCHHHSSGTPFVDVLHHCQYKPTGSDHGLSCNGYETYTLSEHEVMNNGDYLNIGSPAKTPHKIFAKLYRGTDSADWKNFQLYIYNVGWACPDGTPCSKDWRREICNRQGY